MALRRAAPRGGRVVTARRQVGAERSLPEKISNHVAARGVSPQEELKL